MKSPDRAGQLESVPSPLKPVPLKCLIYSPGQKRLSSARFKYTLMNKTDCSRPKIYRGFVLDRLRLSIFLPRGVTALARA